MAQLMPLPLTVSCFTKIQIGFTFLVPAHLGSPGKRVEQVCVLFYWCCPRSMRSIIFVMVRCPSVCLSLHGSRPANLLLQVCCCGPSGQEILINCCTTITRQQQRAVPHCQHTYEAEQRLCCCFTCAFQPPLLNRVQSGNQLNQLAEKLLASQLPSTSTAPANDAPSAAKPTRPVSVTATKQSTADITSMSLASLFENTESGQFGLGFGSGGLLGLRGAMPKMPSFRV